MRELYNQDFYEMLRDGKYPEKYFDLCITSPPYNMNLRVNSKKDAYCSRQIVKEISTKYESFDDNLPMDEYEGFLDMTIEALICFSKVTFFNIQMITGNKPALFRVLGKYADYIKELIIWDKGRAQPAIGEGVLNSQFELIIVFSEDSITRAFDSAKFERGTLSNLWGIPTQKSPNNTHRASFPVELVNQILEGFDAKTVFDPFMGTGTTAIAAHYYGCDFVGCEIDKNYFIEAEKRIERETAQIDLFS